ncbi:hypothetical protein H4Q26_013651 [Puccinia striiformis f. sp. tritici PST-130]|nr:hypothetical protein H4Q26_013651 [Puccinia striiformis f. sp. tritici PST-130]
MGHPSEGVVGTGLEGGLECFKNLASQFIEIPVENIITLHKGSSSLSAISTFASWMHYLRISFSTHSRLITSNCSFQNSTRLELKDLQLGLKNPCSVHLKDGNSDVDRIAILWRLLSQRVDGSRPFCLDPTSNPLSTAGSPLASPSAEETPGLKSKRRQSMADYLTDISKADSTLPENIQRPPVAEPQRRNTYLANLPNVFDEDEEDAPAEFETMARSLSFSNRGDTTSVDKILRPLVSSKADVNSVFSHRGSMPNFPMVEMSYEAYERAEASLDGQSNTPTMEIAGQEIPSMAQSLSELATRDTTIEEAIAHPPAVDSSESYVESTDIRTMDQITRHLSGVADLPIQDTDVTPEQRILRRNATPPELSSKVVMANALTDSVMEDNTLPETQATGHLSGPVDAAGVPIGGGITSLSENEMQYRLAAWAQHVYRGAPINGYTGLKVLRSMSTTLNEAIEKDYTTPEAQAELYRMKQPPIKDQIIGLTEQEMRQRRQSFKLTAEL